MDTQRHLIEHLKLHGPSTIKELVEALAISENAVRHHLSALEKGGWLHQQQEPGKVGRPAVRYALDSISEGLFPKRYPELLDAVLQVAQQHGLMDKLLDGVVEGMVQEVQPHLANLQGPEKLMALLEHLDYGDMLPKLETTPAGWELQAYNCLYYATGLKFEPVCNLLPKLVTQATGLPAERPFCQRDGKRACHFVVARR